jgi:type I restriction enzyme R subunit
MPAPEATARQHIDRALTESGWAVLDFADANLGTSRAVAIREFALTTGYGFADHVLFVDGRAAGVIEAKKAGTTLTGVELQAARYSDGFPDAFPARLRPLPFLYQSTGLETRFSSRLDPDPRSRRVFQFHQPATIATTLDSSDATARMPRIAQQRLAHGQSDHLQFRVFFASLRYSLRLCVKRLRRLSRTFTAISAIYRLMKFAETRRILFLVDRGNLGRQTMKEFQQYATPDDGRKFTELYNLQHLKTNRLDPVARVCITTIQRLYSMLRGGDELASIFGAPYGVPEYSCPRNTPGRRSTGVGPHHRARSSVARCLAA